MVTAQARYTSGFNRPSDPEKLKQHQLRPDTHSGPIETLDLSTLQKVHDPKNGWPLSPRGQLIRHSYESGRRGAVRDRPTSVKRKPYMASYMFVYRHGTQTFGPMSPEEMQQNTEASQAWMHDGFQKGWLVNPGDGLEKEGCAFDSKKVVADGPFVESKEIGGGFTIIEAEGIGAAAEMAKGCPFLLTGGTVEVRPLEGYTLSS
jgi:hypothetical protein